MSGNHAARLAALRHPPAEVAARAGRIYRAVLGGSARLRAGNFEALGVTDLRLLFALYDFEFFDGLLGAMLRDAGAGEVEFRLSARMTRAAGKTIYRKVRERVGARVVERPAFEIAISTLLLFQTFGDVDRPVTVGGLACRDRLEALQRIFEHELLHLAEFLTTGRSSCSAEPFRRLSRDLFGHAGVVHDLVTPREVAARTLAVQTGDRVSFDLDGATRSGVVNRITKRATVLVEDPAGRPFSDGRRYLTYYVPLPLLRKDGPA